MVLPGGKSGRRGKIFPSVELSRCKTEKKKKHTIFANFPRIGKKQLAKIAK